MNLSARSIMTLACLAAALSSPGCASDTPPETTTVSAAQFTGYVYDASGELVGPKTLSKVVRTDGQWRAVLTPSQYEILRRAGTERAFTGALLENKADGVYRCAACDLPLFSSQTKFESGTGWPSFYRPIGAGNVAERDDLAYGMRRTEILCGRCDGHLGHVFEDGPKPTGLRYCLNSESLAFTPIEEVGTLADPAANMTNASMSSMPPGRAAAVFASGCFWCVEAVFEELEGVDDAISGYAGGTKETANYKAVCTGTTKHAEAVRIIYDPSKIRYEDLLRVFFATHDPTQLNRQGPDTGTQYRSAIFYANAEEKALAEAILEDLSDQKVYKSPVVTTLEPLTEFFPAESYHQNYVCINPQQPYVRAVALPKVEKVRKQFKDRLKEKSPLERK